MQPVCGTVTHHLAAKTVRGGGGRHYYPPLWHVVREDGDEVDLEKASVEVRDAKGCRGGERGRERERGR